MCTVALAGLAISTASAYVGYQAQAAQAAAQAQVNRATASSLQDSLKTQYETLDAERHQTRDVVSQQIAENRLDGLRARARAQTAAGEAGVSGLSVDAQMRDFFARELGFEQTQVGNFESFNHQQGLRARAAHAGAATQAANLPSVNKPSWLDAGLRIGAAGVNAWEKSQT